MEKRSRLSRSERHEQLLELARQMVRNEGSEALTLGRLAQRAGVTKPIVYDHFGSRTGLLIELYQAFDARQNELIDVAIGESGPDLGSRAGVLAATYVECVVTQGRELPGVVAALSGSPELEQVKSEAEIAFRDKCRRALEPFAQGPLSDAKMAGMLGAAQALGRSAVRGEVSEAAAKRELAEIIASVVGRPG
ncbi:TetR/AcrR family transcriptional regulator [Sphingomonas sp. NSE70-1]|uniref:TetR/AcrR family transcriptional regulator n=1 Tax=Sphingomonas caseinilyticus TaxID=2908205 RepID=A0ABT0RRV2_9SPHN|nr:TetR/AcrR family transcriptional regulator [Sphingomonas caseinilyticus]